MKVEDAIKAFGEFKARTVIVDEPIDDIADSSPPAGTANDRSPKDTKDIVEENERLQAQNSELIRAYSEELEKAKANGAKPTQPKDDGRKDDESKDKEFEGALRIKWSEEDMERWDEIEGQENRFTSAHGAREPFTIIENYRNEIVRLRSQQRGVPVASHQPKDDGRKDDESKDRWDLVPLEAMTHVAKVLTFGAEKYGPGDWRRVPDRRARYLAAAMRHIVAWSVVEENDAESGQPHLSHAITCLLFLLQNDIEESRP